MRTIKHISHCCAGLRRRLVLGTTICMLAVCWTFSFTGFHALQAHPMAGAADLLVQHGRLADSGRRVRRHRPLRRGHHQAVPLVFTQIMLIASVGATINSGCT